MTSKCHLDADRVQRIPSRGAPEAVSCSASNKGTMLGLNALCGVLSLSCSYFCIRSVRSVPACLDTHERLQFELCFTCLLTTCIRVDASDIFRADCTQVPNDIYLSPSIHTLCTAGYLIAESGTVKWVLPVGSGRIHTGPNSTGRSVQHCSKDVVTEVVEYRTCEFRPSHWWERIA